MAATEKDEPARRSLGGRKTPQCRAKSGPVFATDGVVGQLFNSETNEFQETSASTKHLYTPSAGLWRSMEDSVKEVGSAADQFNPAGTNTLGLTSFGDSALNLDPGQALKKAGESASKFDAVHSLKQFGESAHSAASMFGRSAIQINLAKDPFNLLLKSGPFLEENKEPEQIKSAAHGGRVADINGTDLKLVKSKESHLALVSPWRDRDGILHAIPQKSPTGESDKSQNAGKSSETQSLHLDEVEEGPKVWTQGASVALEPVTPTPQMAVGIREVSAPFISRAHSTPSHTSPHSNLQVVAEKPEEWRGIEPIRNANEMEATGIGLHTISKGLESAMAELGHLRAAFEQDGNAMMSAHNHCVKTLQIARRDAQNARAKLADSSKHSSAASAQDLVALCNEVEALCTQLEQARVQILSERQRREEAEQLLRTVNKTLANHKVASELLCKAEAESSQLRDEKTKSDSHARNLSPQLQEANLSVNELKAQLTESQLKRAAAERSVTEMHAKLELQNETENNRSKFDERRGRDFERLQKDFEQEKAQRLHEEEHVLQVRSDLKANDERDRQKDTLVQRELETLRAAIQNERQHRKVDARSEELTEGRVGALPENISRLDHDIPKTSLQQIETKTAAQFKTKTVMESQNAEMQQEDSRLRASKQLEPVPCTENSDKSGGDGASLTLQLDIREKEVTRLSEEVANLKSSLAASRAENSMLAERIYHVNSGSDGDAPGIPFQPGAGSGELSRGQDKRGSNSASDLAKSVQFVLEQERSKWEKEKKSLQAQVAKLLQVRGSYPSTCVHARLPAFF